MQCKYCTEIQLGDSQEDIEKEQVIGFFCGYCNKYLEEESNANNKPTYLGTEIGSVKSSEKE